MSLLEKAPPLLLRSGYHLMRLGVAAEGAERVGTFKIYYNLFSISSDVDLLFVLIEGLCN